MDLSFLFTIPLKINMINEEIELKKIPKAYAELRNNLKEEYKIPDGIKIEYMDDIAQLQPIENQASYEEALKCTNGQWHFMFIRDQIPKINNPQELYIPLTE